MLRLAVGSTMNVVNYFDVEAGATYRFGCSVYKDKTDGTLNMLVAINLNTDGATTLTGTADTNTKTVNTGEDYNVKVELGYTYTPTTGGGIKYTIVRLGNTADYVYADNAYIYKIKDAVTGLE